MESEIVFKCIQEVSFRMKGYKKNKNISYVLKNLLMKKECMCVYRCRYEYVSVYIWTCEYGINIYCWIKYINKKEDYCEK